MGRLIDGIWREHHFGDHVQLLCVRSHRDSNPTGAIPRGPRIDLLGAHDHARIPSTASSHGG